LTRSSTGNSLNATLSGEGNVSPSPASVSLVLDGSHKPFLFRMLQEGFFVTTKAGISIKDFLTDYLKIDSDYISRRISTLLLNGIPVDDLDSETLADGSVLALSAAMPGLAGSIFRKGGYLAGLRSKVGKKDIAAKPDSDAWVKVKLFNALVADLGPGLLSRGIWIKASSLNALRQEGKICAKTTGSYPTDEMIHIVITIS